ncbi:MAG: Integrase catalytic region [Methylobacterium brachiatum]|nr:Integrase catalytic region [Methylobacterium brachiatum]
MWQAFFTAAPERRRVPHPEPVEERAELQAAKESRRVRPEPEDARRRQNPHGCGRQGRPRRRSAALDGACSGLRHSQNLAKHCKALRWKTPFQTLYQAWTNGRDRLRINPHHLVPGSYTWRIHTRVRPPGCEAPRFPSPCGYGVYGRDSVAPIECAGRRCRKKPGLRTSPDGPSPRRPPPGKVDRARVLHGDDQTPGTRPCLRPAGCCAGSFMARSDTDGPRRCPPRRPRSRSRRRCPSSRSGRTATHPAPGCAHPRPPNPPIPASGTMPKAANSKHRDRLRTGRSRKGKGDAPGVSCGPHPPAMREHRWRMRGRKKRVGPSGCRRRDRSPTRPPRDAAGGRAPRPRPPPARRPPRLCAGTGASPPRRRPGRRTPPARSQ